MFDFETEFKTNRQPRCACVLLLDTSSSMAGKPIDALNAGLRRFSEELRGSDLASKRIEVAVIQFPPVSVEPFVAARDFVPRPLAAGGDTPLGAAMQRALELVEERKAVYRDNRIDYYRPWIFVLTDGEPTDSCTQASIAAQRAVAERRAVIWPVAVGDQVNMAVLSKLSNKPPARLKGLAFAEMFVWLSRSLNTLSQSQTHSGGDPQQSVPLSTVGDWAEV